MSLFPVRLGPRTLYGSIKRMLAKGLIEEAEERPDPTLGDERRRYYRLTRAGRAVAAAEARRLDELVSDARNKRLLPAEFRGEYGREMGLMFRDRYRHEESLRRRRGVWRLWGETLLDILKTAPSEHWDLLKQDTRIALRAIRRNRGFTLAAVMTLALGTGAGFPLKSAPPPARIRGLAVNRRRAPREGGLRGNKETGGVSGGVHDSDSCGVWFGSAHRLLEPAPLEFGPAPNRHWAETHLPIRVDAVDQVDLLDREHSPPRPLSPLSPPLDASEASSF